MPRPRGSDASSPEARLEALEELLAELAEANRQVPVLVEGEKDERALRALGLEGEIVRVKNAQTVFAVCERLAMRHREVIVITDWDAGGGKLMRLVRDGLKSCGVRPDLAFRRSLARHTRREIHQVESLAAYLARLRRDARADG